MSRSKPVYVPLVLEREGVPLIVADCDPAEGFDVGVDLAGAEVWVVGAMFGSVDGLLKALPGRLRVAGTRLYVVGSEGFVWDVRNLAVGAGFDERRVFLARGRSARRRVYCAHCKLLNEDVVVNLVACGGCGRWLLVGDHFSRRLGAYLGVMADAEEVGVLPAVAVLYS